jgi:hypothetical protein
MSVFQAHPPRVGSSDGAHWASSRVRRCPARAQMPSMCFERKRRHEHEEPPSPPENEGANQLTRVTAFSGNTQVGTLRDGRKET